MDNLKRGKTTAPRHKRTVHCCIGALVFPLLKLRIIFLIEKQNHPPFKLKICKNSVIFLKMMCKEYHQNAHDVRN